LVGVQEKLGSMPEWGVVCMSKESVENVIRGRFGVSLEELDISCFEGFAYLESTQSYYFAASKSVQKFEAEASKVEIIGDDTVRVYYTGNAYFTNYKDVDCVATVQWVNRKWRRDLSNQKAE
jgi:hypothetical protein